MAKICATILLMLCFALTVSGCTFQSPADVKKRLENSLPVGSSKADVVSYLERNGFEHSGGFKPALYYDKSKEISAVAPGKKYGILTTARVYVIVRFSEDDRLMAIETREVKTGL